jgi:copper chaperone/Cu+-exporting ATPase
MSEYTLHVPAMSCASCETMVREAVTRLPGVATVEADAETGTVTVTGEPDSRERAAQAINESGYPVEQ